MNLSGCKYITDSGIKVLVENCKKVTHLNLTRLPKLTEEGMIAVSTGGLVDLEYLNLYASTSISDQAFKNFAKSGYSKMTFLDLCGCKNI